MSLGKSNLVLLCSQPDTIRKHPMHRTQVSTPLSKGSSHCRKASEGYHPSYSNWLQDAANAPARPLFYGKIAELSMLVSLEGT